MKLLFISNIMGEKVGSFSLASIMAAKNLGYEFHLAANFKNSTTRQMREDEDKYGIQLHNIDFERNPLNPYNIHAFKQLLQLVKNEKFDMIHCNTPVGGVAGRLVGKQCGITKVIYQAHGFHFYKGAPIINWLVYYGIERLLAHYTDALITINKEDFLRAQKFHLRKGGKAYYVPGVGVDTSAYRFDEEVRERKRAELGVTKDDVVIISVGELNKNKNNCVIVEALKKLLDKRIHYFLCGDGPLLQELHNLAEPIKDRVHFLGYRTDVKELLVASDIFVLPSLREGLSRSLMEAMVSGLPCIVSNIRGNVDLIKQEDFVCSLRDTSSFVNAISKLSLDQKLRKAVGKFNAEYVKEYSIEKVQGIIANIYQEQLTNFKH